MRTAINILHKVVVNHFYKVNAGFFMFMFFVLFGLPYNVKQFHLGIIDIIISNQPFLAFVMVVWLLYNVKCMDYVIKQLRQPQQQFLFCITNFPFYQCYLCLLYVQFLVYLPMFAYAMFVVVIAAKAQHFICAAEIILFSTAVIATTTFVYVTALQRRTLFKIPALISSPGIRISKPLFVLPLFYIWHSRKQMLFISKIFSLLFLYAFIKLYQPDHYDIRPLLLCFMLSTAANSAIVFEMKIFEDFFMQAARNFPLSVTRRFANCLLTFTILLLPELLFVWKGYPTYFTIMDYIQLLLLGVGLLAIFNASLFTDDMNMDIYMKVIFGILALLLFVILYNPGILLEILLLAIAFGLYASYYFDFEKKYD